MLVDLAQKNQEEWVQLISIITGTQDQEMAERTAKSYLKKRIEEMIKENPSLRSSDN